MGWHPICKSKSNQIVPRPTDKSMPKGASFQKTSGRAHAKASAKAELPVGCREPAGRDQGAATQASPPSPSHGPFCWKEKTFIHPNIFQLKHRSPLSHFSQLWIDLLDFPILSLPTRLFETLWMEVSDADVPSHPFPSLVFCEVFKLTSCLGLQCDCIQTFHPISPCSTWNY